MHRIIAAVFALSLLCGFANAESKSKLFGKAPSVAEPTKISTVTTNPDKYVNQTLLFAGTVVDVCRHRGCWVEIQSGDSARVICRSMDETVLFPESVLGHKIQLQGKVLYDAKAPGSVTEKHEGGEAHACPAPQIMVSIEGAVVDDFAETVTQSAEPKQ